MKIINKQMLVAKLMEKVNFDSKAAAERFLNAFLDTVTETLIAGDKIQIIGFGTFETKERSARTARNPQTGEELQIDAKKVPAFKAGKAFKEAVNK